METTQIDLTPFCDTESGRYALDIVYVRKGYRHGCNGRIIARVPTDEPNTPEETGKFPDSSELFAKFPTEGFAPLADVLGEPEPHPKGYLTACNCLVLGRCRECHGTGNTECYSCGQDCECEECEGTGKSAYPKNDCKECNGNGQVPMMTYIIDGERFRSDYIEKIRALPNAEVVCIAGETTKRMLAFRFDGNGQGLLMCMVE